MGDVSAWVVLGLAVVVLAALTAAWLSWTAGRLDRMHLRVEAAQSALQTQLQRRASVGVELAGAGLGDPASSLLLLEAARSARDSQGQGARQWVAESDLTAVLHEVQLPSPAAEPLTAELLDAARKAGMARRIHNDLVATTRSLHERRRVRWFRLAGHAVTPSMIDFDDRCDFA